MEEINKKKAGERLREIVTKTGYKSDRQFAISIGVDVSFFAKAIKGTALLSEKYINKLYQIHKVNPDFYRYGAPSMFAPYTPPDNELKEVRLNNV